jgi:hypothetical protein
MNTLKAEEVDGTAYHDAEHARSAIATFIEEVYNRQRLYSALGYAPELNPAENIRQYLRQNALSHLVWESYEVIVDACCDAWNDLIATPSRIRSIGSRQWALVIG